MAQKNSTEPQQKHTFDDTLWLGIGQVIGETITVDNDGHRKREVVRYGLLGTLSRAAFYAAIKRGELPPPRKLGSRSLWSKEQLLDAVAALPKGTVK